MARSLTLTESRDTSLLEALAPGSVATAAEFDVVLITPGWGSSGYYSADMLREAAEAGRFADGTHMYMDHPASGDRPERSVRDLAGTFREARWDETIGDEGGVRAKVRPYSTYAPFIAEAAADIGLSIRGAGDFTIGEAEGRRGRIFTSLSDIASVDYVTRAGRGGRILSMLESYRPGFAAATEARVQDRREELIKLVRDAHGSEDVYIWVRDFDDTARTLWYEQAGPEEFGIYQQNYTVGEDDAVTGLDGDPVEVRVRTEYVPVSGGTADVADTGSESDTTESRRGSSMPDITEARLTELNAAEEAAKRVPTLEAENAELRQRIALGDAREAAKPVIGAALEGATLPQPILESITAEALEAVAVTDDGKLDETAVKESAARLRKKAEEHDAALRESLGYGRPRGFGHATEGAPGLAPQAPDQAAATESLDKVSGDIFGRRPSTQEA